MGPDVLALPFEKNGDGEHGQLMVTNWENKHTNLRFNVTVGLSFDLPSTYNENKKTTAFQS